MEEPQQPQSGCAISSVASNNNNSINNNNNCKGDQEPLAPPSQQQNGSSPSSPFELRRHRSFYDSTSSGGVMVGGANNKRRASAKAKSSSQLLNFFTRSQSHEPKNSVEIEDGATAGAGGEEKGEVAGTAQQGPTATQPVPPVPVAKPRKQRPQSLYTKTTSSKQLQYRISGIATTPETPEVEHEENGGGGERVGEIEALLMTTTSEVVIEEKIEESAGMDGSNKGGGSGENSSSRSSVSSNSDSYASCGTRGDEEVDNFEEGAGTRTKKDAGRQSLKHLSVSAPAMRTASQKSSGGDGSDTGLPPMTTSKSRQKKFHRHFKNVPQDEKVLDYYSCALVGDILLQGFLYITENYFAFYSNVFGYVTKVLIPVCTVVRITKERTAKIFPNAVGVCTRTEKHVFASLISRDTTFKLMYKVWNYSIEQEAEEIRQIQRRVAAQVEAEDGFSAEVPIPDESSGDSGSGNDSAIEPSSHSPSPQNTPGIEKLVLAKSGVTSHVSGGTTVVTAVGDDKSAVTLAKLASSEDPSVVPNILTYRGATHQYRTSIPGGAAASNAHLLHGTAQRQSASQQNTSADSSKFRRFVKSFGLSVGGRGPSLLLVATALLVILFISAALLLNRISSLQQRLLERPVIHDSEQFYQELLSWQTKLHSTTGDEIHQYINSNLQQIVKVRESLEALSMLFVNRPQGAAGVLGEPHPSSIIGGGEPTHHQHHKDS